MIWIDDHRKRRYESRADLTPISVISVSSNEVGERLITEAGATEDRTPEAESLLPNEKEMSAGVCVCLR